MPAVRTDFFDDIFVPFNELPDEAVLYEPNEVPLIKPLANVATANNETPSGYGRMMIK